MAHRDQRTPRLFVAEGLAAGVTLRLDHPRSHYLANVMRLRPGDAVALFNGRDGEWLARLLPLAGKAATVVVERQTRAQERGPDLHYLFAPLKHARLDYMVQKAVEMGVSRIAPVITERTQATRVNLDRMRANAVEAAEQCGLLGIPEIAVAEPLPRALAALDKTRGLIFCDEEAPPGDPIATLKQTSPGPLAMLIGPEGGFSPKERRLILQHDNVVRLSLGPRVMRADTAAVAALALVQAVLGDWARRTIPDGRSSSQLK